MDLLSEWYSELISKNEEIRKERVDTVYFLAVPTPVVEIIFLICLFFGQPEEVRYLSVEIFEKFIRQHFMDLLDKVWKKKYDSASEQWKIVEQKLNSQTSLRMLSCIQIASKFITHKKIIRPKEIQLFLKAEGKSYNLSMILASEIRVWKTLKMQINIPTVFTYVDILTEHLSTCRNLPLSYSELRSRVTCLVDITYLHHHEIYRKLFYLSTGRWEPTTKEKQEFLAIEGNLLYRSVAILALSINFTSRELYDDVISQLSLLTNISSEEIKALVDTLTQIVFS